MHTLDTFDFSGKKVLIRVDFNVPLNAERSITDTNRIDAAAPGIRQILEKGAAVILMSHLGRPKEGPEDKFSLRHLLPYLNECFKTTVAFAPDCIGEEAAQKAAALKAGDILLLENLRFYKEETKGDRDFAAKLAALGDVYVNDAFGTAHRAHASTAIIADFFPKAKLFGALMQRELESIEKVLHNAQRPFTAVLGGAKISGKIEIINNLLDKADNILIGGGMMFTFLKAMGRDVGSSLVEEDLLPVAKEAMEKAKEKGVTLLIPEDTIAAERFDNDAEQQEVDCSEIPEGWMGLDIGPFTIGDFSDVLSESKTILWNGPMGVFEMENFANGTREIAYAIAEATDNGAFSLIGGGDSVAAISKYGLSERVSYVSTGGGAMLEFIEGKELPGVAAIKKA